MNTYVKLVENFMIPQESFRDVESEFKELKGQFKLPIEYNSLKRNLEKHVVDSIELKKQNEIIYGKTTNKSHEETLSKVYTTDVMFLKNHQIFIKEFNLLSKIDKEHHKHAESFYKKWRTQMMNANIRETYYYMDWEHLDFLNYNSSFMLFLSLYNLSSPVTTIITPIIIFLLPFIALKCFTNIPLTKESYMHMLYRYGGRNPLAKCISLLTGEGDINQKVSGMSMLFIFLTSVYQSFLVCYRFYQNMYKLKSYIQNTRDLFSRSIENIDDIESVITKHNMENGFELFLQDLRVKRKQMKRVVDELHNMDSEIFSIKNIFQIGKYMSTFYSFRQKKENQKLFRYAFELEEFVFHYQHIYTHIQSKAIQTCSFGKKTHLVKSYHPCLISKENNAIKNNVSIEKNLVITGPNASGKTTLIKNAIINSIYSQQLGYGCYDSDTEVCMYDAFYSYLNIPDTSGRDSLFQAEARRCLEIIESIKENSAENKRSFMIFDELYSGTNPSEATISAIAFIKHIMKYNVSFMITTHYYDICKTKLLNRNLLENVHMKTTKETTHELKYHYTLENGPCYQHGGFMVLREMNYPQEILDDIVEIENNVHKSEKKNVKKESKSKSKEKKTKTKTNGMKINHSSNDEPKTKAKGKANSNPTFIRVLKKEEDIIRDLSSI